MFLLTDENLYPDKVASLKFLEFENSSLSREYIEQALKLSKTIPEELIDNDKEVYGCPDCADQGTYYLQIKTVANILTRHIDPNGKDQSEEIIKFGEKLLETTLTISN